MGITTLRASTALAAICISTPVLAVTPAEVWQSWQDMASSYGQTITSDSVDEADDAVTVTGLVITNEQDGVKTEATMGELVFTDNGDDTVDVTMSGDIPMVLTLPPAEGETSPTTVSISILQPDMLLTASGTADAVTYEFSGPEITVKLDKIEGVDASAVDLVAEAKLTDLAGSYSVESGAENVQLGYEMTAASLNMTLSGKDLDPSPAPDGTESGPSDVNVVLSMADLGFSGEGTPLNAAMFENLGAALASGVTSSSDVSAGATTLVMDLTEAGKLTNLNMTGATSSFNFSLGPDGFGYGGSGTDVQMAVVSPDIPFPELKLSYAEATFDLLAPVVKAAEPQDFVLLTKLVDFTISDEVWAMFDPTGQLPRDPATLVIDTTGTATVTADVMDPAAMEAMETAPGELNTIDITEVRAKMAGAELTGSGAFTFDNTDMTTFAGFPAPTGKLDLKLTGGNGLMDKLVAMGMLSEDDVTGFRMMMAMFANTAADKDEMTSTLEFKDKGFFANGQRLQ